MNADIALHQRIARLTPLTDVLAAIARISPVAPRTVALADACGCALASRVIATAAQPAVPVALHDGWAVNAEETRDAGPYAPLALQPSPQRREAFAALPPGTDAVAPLDTVSIVSGIAQITAPLTPGEGALPAGGDVEAGDVLREAGSRLRDIDVAALAGAGIASVVIRQPNIRVVNTRPGDAILSSAAAMLVRAITAAGAKADVVSDLDKALRDDDADAIIGIGGTGSGRGDRSVIALSRAGTVTCHGIGLVPGETSALGAASGRPVLLVPGRVDAALAAWLVLGRAMVDRLSGVQADGIAIRMMLARKVTSTVGVAEVVLLQREGNKVRPLASGYLPLRSLARADGWMLVPGESEGYAAGAEIGMRLLP